MTYITEHQSPDGIAKVIYQSKDGKTSKTFDGLDWLAQLTTHIPDKNEQMVRYGACPPWRSFYSNKSRGMRREADKEDDVPALIHSELSRKEFRKNWARLIQKIYNVDPLSCPKCLGSMKIIPIIEDEQVISKILKHLGLWVVKQKPRPRDNEPPLSIHTEYSARPGATTSYVRIGSVHGCLMVITSTPLFLQPFTTLSAIPCS
jgi:hypothetical protein